MRKQTLFLAASVALVLAMSSLGQAQSNFSETEIYGQVEWSDQDIIEPASVSPVGVPVSSLSAYAPAPPIPLGETQNAASLVLPAVPVLNAFPVPYMPPAEQVFQVQQILPATMMQPVCTPRG